MTTSPSHPSPAARRARAATHVFFWANGWCLANVVPRYPELKGGLDLGNDAFGAAVAAYGVGALLTGLVAGPLVARLGSRRVAIVASLGACSNLCLIPWAPVWVVLATTLLVAGALDSLSDMGANVQGLRVEAIVGRSVLNAMHGSWSIGAVLGGLAGSGAAGLAVPLRIHLVVAAAVAAGLISVAARSLLHDDPPPAGPTARSSRARRSTRALLSAVLLGAVAAMGQTIEDVTATWSAVYLRGDLGTTAAIAGLGFVALQAAQVVGRFLGDALVTRFGDRRVAVVAAIPAGLAMAVVLAAPTPGRLIAGLGLAGLCIGTLIPGSLRGADALRGLPAGVGLSVVGTAMRLALFVSPLATGLLAERLGVQAALVVIPGAFLVVVALAPVLPDIRRR